MIELLNEVAKAESIDMLIPTLISVASGLILSIATYVIGRAREKKPLKEQLLSIIELLKKLTKVFKDDGKPKRSDK